MSTLVSITESMSVHVLVQFGFPEILFSILLVNLMPTLSCSCRCCARIHNHGLTFSRTALLSFKPVQLADQMTELVEAVGPSIKFWILFGDKIANFGKVGPSRLIQRRLDSLLQALLDDAVHLNLGT